MNSTLHVSLAPELQQALSDRRLDLVGALRNEGVEVEHSREDLPHTPNEGTKSAEIVIGVLAVGLPATIAAIAKLFRTITSRPMRIENKELVPILDANGKQVVDDAGHLLFQWRTIGTITETKPPTPGQSYGSFQAGRVKASFYATDP